MSTNPVCGHSHPALLYSLTDMPFSPLLSPCHLFCPCASFLCAAASDPFEEVFSLLVALVGLAGFALALALVEQIVLETNLANVSRGSRVYEAGHVSVGLACDWRVGLWC